MNLTGFVLRNAVRNRRRTALTVTSVALSLFLFVSLRTLLTELEGDSLMTRQSSLRLMTRHAISLKIPLPIAQKARIERLRGVDWVSEYQWFATWVRDPKNMMVVFGIDPRIAGRDPEYVWSPGAIQEFKGDRRCFVAPVKMTKRFGWKIGDRVTFAGMIMPFDLELRLCGTIDGPAQSNPLMHFSYVNELAKQRMPGRGDRTTSYFTKVFEVEDAPRVAREIDEMFANTESPTRTESEKGFVLSFTAMLGNVKLFLSFIALAVIFAIVLVTSNTMSMAVRERTTEIAVMKTLGFGRLRILTLIVGESLVISIVGGFLGVAAVYAFFGTFDIYHLTNSVIQHFEVRPSTLLQGALIALGMGLISALLPGWHAVRQSIVKSLREIR